jgi:hypothetical protein
VAQRRGAVARRGGAAARGRLPPRFPFAVPFFMRGAVAVVAA